MKTTKKFMGLISAVILAISLTACGSAGDNSTESTRQASSTLIAYFSYTGNTEEVAEQIADYTGGTIVEIERATPYENMNDEAEEEINNGVHPEITVDLESIENYDTIFIGYPIWLAYHKLIQCTQLREWVHFKFIYKVLAFAPAIGRGFFYWQKKSTSFPVWE